MTKQQRLKIIKDLYKEWKMAKWMYRSLIISNK